MAAIYQCSYCKFLFPAVISGYYERLEHEKYCVCNPIMKSCRTCSNYQLLASQDETIADCKIDKLGNKHCITNCEFYQSKE